MENSIEIITSERGKDLASVYSSKYRFIRQPKDGYMKWMCTNKKCYVSVLTNCQRSTVLSISGEHNHVIDPVEKIQRQFLRENCKRKVGDAISTRPLKIIKTELIRTDYKLQHKDILSIQKAMYNKRLKNCPYDLSMK